VNPLTNPDSPEVTYALTRPCWLCRRLPGEACLDLSEDVPPGTLLQDRTSRQIVHFARISTDPAPEPRKPGTRKPPARRAPVSAAKPIVVEGKDISRKK
jgi:hypothetical protein